MKEIKMKSRSVCCKDCGQNVTTYYDVGGVCPTYYCRSCVLKKQEDTEEPCEFCGNTLDSVYRIKNELICDKCLDRLEKVA